MTEQERAHQIVAKAVSERRLEREPCEICGDEPALAHHDNYADPLSVKWLCSSCHKLMHRALAGKPLALRAAIGCQVTVEMKLAVEIAAATAGTSTSDWLRGAVSEKLARG